MSGALAGCVLLSCAFASLREASIGAVLVRERSGAVLVREVPHGHAAWRAGLATGDRIKMVDGSLVDDLDAARLRGLLRGAVGSRAVLTVLRGDQVLELTVAREPLGPAAR